MREESKQLCWYQSSRSEVRSRITLHLDNASMTSHASLCSLSLFSFISRYILTAFSLSSSIIFFNPSLTGILPAGIGAFVDAFGAAPLLAFFSVGGAIATSVILRTCDASANSVRPLRTLARGTRGSTEVSAVAFPLPLLATAASATREGSARAAFLALYAFFA